MKINFFEIGMIASCDKDAAKVAVMRIIGEIADNIKMVKSIKYKKSY